MTNSTVAKRTGVSSWKHLIDVHLNFTFEYEKQLLTEARVTDDRCKRRLGKDCSRFLSIDGDLLSFLESREYFVSFVFINQCVQPLETSSLQRWIDIC